MGRIERALEVAEKELNEAKSTNKATVRNGMTLASLKSGSAQQKL